MTTKIEWTDATWNQTTGCTKVSGGCKHCYAERTWQRLSANPKTVYFGRKFTDVQCHPERLEQPLHWTNPRRIFVNSMSDLFHEDVPYEFIAKVFAVMARCPQHTFQILTKRPERMKVFMMSSSYSNLPNVHLGVSVEDQETANRRIPTLMKTPAAVRWISAEPLLGPIHLSNLTHPYDPKETRLSALTGMFRHKNKVLAMYMAIDWVVVGGESGPKARPMNPDWVRSIRDQCAAAKIPFMFKQWGEYSPNPETGQMIRVGKKAAGRTLDGVIHDGYPA